MKPRIPSSLPRRIGRFVAQYEKLLLAVLSVVIVISGTFWYREYSSRNDTGPTVGGTYVDGIVGDEKDVQTIASKLTKTGLFSFTQSGELQNQLITKWEVDEEKTVYSFQIDPEVDGNEIVAALNDNLDLLGPSQVDLLDGNTLIIQLAKGNPNLPLLLSQPLFDYGPYKVSKMTGKTTVFTRNTRTKSVSPFINKIIVHSYDSEAELEEAYRKRNIDGGVGLSGATPPEKYVSYEFALPRYYAIVVNVNRAPFRDLASRQALWSNSFTKPFTLTVPEEDVYKEVAAPVIAAWQAAGVPVTVEYKTLEEIAAKTGPSRDFQVMVTGIDYGAELNPYYLWHSSQLRPPANNISGVKDDQIDAAITRIEADLNPISRRAQISALHTSLENLGAVRFLRQEKERFYLSTDIRFAEPFLPLGLRDRWQSVSGWSVK